MKFDAVLLLSFGGPDKHDDVIPFLENVLRGKNVPRERMLEVAEHYYHFDGRSPINDQNRELLLAVRGEMTRRGLNLPVYWGNRNWRPYLADTLREMHAAGHRRIAAFVTSAFGSYSGCRQYREDIGRAIQETGLADQVDVEKLPHFCLRDEFIAVMSDRVREAAARAPDARELVFTAHSIPLTMARTSPYVDQLQEACRRTAEASGFGGNWVLVYQSRSGPPSQPWLEPDILAHIRVRHSAGVKSLVVCPIGFISDHMEVLYDLDTEAAALCQELGVEMSRAATPGVHPGFVRLIGELIEEGVATPAMDHCLTGCCPAPIRAHPAR
jgi:ferrochelatase